MTTRRGFVSALVGAGASYPVMRGHAFRRLFDAHHIAGTLDYTTSLDVAGKQPETIKATFDFACPFCKS